MQQPDAASGGEEDKGYKIRAAKALKKARGWFNKKPTVDTARGPHQILDSAEPLHIDVVDGEPQIIEGEPLGAVQEAVSVKTKKYRPLSSPDSSDSEELPQIGVRDFQYVSRAPSGRSPAYVKFLADREKTAAEEAVATIKAAAEISDAEVEHATGKPVSLEQ
ncbi:hypothetical protein LTR53_007309 [Teratosphaeriaceae sp. CCFEE 6253]|nr:hypothetical protein LTR53_007309 [Teratosphaeriaceae sp. CCFEE 6253]